MLINFQNLEPPYGQMPQGGLYTLSRAGNLITEGSKDSNNGVPLKGLEGDI